MIYKYSCHLLINLLMIRNHSTLNAVGSTTMAIIFADIESDGAKIKVLV